VAEAVNKGFHGFDYQLAYAAVYKDAMTPPNGDTTHRWADRNPGDPFSAREGLTYYKQYGYVPENWTARAASCTLEGAYDDWCVAQVAKAIGNTNDYDFFLDRSRNYRNVFNSETSEMNSRYADGKWASPRAGWSEGGQPMYDFCVMQDVPGLINLMGGLKNFNTSLDKKTTDLNRLVNNEPGNHYLYLYDFSGEPWKCQSLSRAALTNFNDTPAGLPGNDDCGQTSCWLLFDNLGFYPVNPASGIYMIGSPVFERVILHFPNGHTFKISARNNSATNKYIQLATLNGVPLNEPCLTYSQIMAGGSLNFVMGPKPSVWASAWRAVPLPCAK
jgi:predicted alpha-1,2-mannosidase